MRGTRQCIFLLYVFVCPHYSQSLKRTLTPHGGHQHNTKPNHTKQTRFQLLLLLVALAIAHVFRPRPRPVPHLAALCAAFFCLLPAPVLHALRFKLLLCGVGLAVPATLMPVMAHLWLRARAGNANYLFFQGYVWNVFSTLVVLEMALVLVKLDDVEEPSGREEEEEAAAEEAEEEGPRRRGRAARRER